MELGEPARGPRPDPGHRRRVHRRGRHPRLQLPPGRTARRAGPPRRRQPHPGRRLPRARRQAHDRDAARGRVPRHRDPGRLRRPPELRLVPDEDVPRARVLLRGDPAAALLHGHRRGEPDHARRRLRLDPAGRRALARDRRGRALLHVAPVQGRHGAGGRPQPGARAVTPAAPRRFGREQRHRGVGLGRVRAARPRHAAHGLTPARAAPAHRGRGRPGRLRRR